MKNVSGKFIRLEIPMIPKMELVAQSALISFCDLSGFPKSKSEDASLALIEACINAFEHSHSDDQLLVISIKLDDSRLKIEIRDNGIGFDPELVAVPEIDSKLKSEHKRGWGLQLMRKMMDEVTFTSDKNGTLISMVKYK